MARVFSIDFLGESSAKSYTLAGAFVTWAVERFGSETLRRWYAGEDLAALAHEPWAQLDADWRASLAAMPLAPGALAYAKAKFDRPSVFGRRCPHVVDALRREADGCRESVQVDRARSLYGEVLLRDPHDWAARWGLGIVELRYGGSAEGARELRVLADDEQTPRPWKDRTEESLADAALASNDPARWVEAANAYESLAKRAVDEDQGRTLEVKAYAATKSEARGAVAALLVGEKGRPIDADEGLARVAAWAATSHDPVAEYVLGKNLANHEFWSEAAAHFDAAIAVGEPTLRIGRELLRQRAIAACALGDRETAWAMRERVAEGAGPFAESVGRREWVLALIERCAGR